MIPMKHSAHARTIAVPWLLEDRACSLAVLAANRSVSISAIIKEPKQIDPNEVVIARFADRRVGLETGITTGEEGDEEIPWK
jgi:hypothetical protein